MQTSKSTIKAKHSYFKDHHKASKCWFSWSFLCNAVAVGLQLRTPETNIGEAETDEIRIVLIGKTGVGKSATGNSILGKEVFDSTNSPSSVTQDCKKESTIIYGRKISVIDTPGIFDTRKDEESKQKVAKEIKKCISYSAPGPHAFLVINTVERHTDENQKTLEYIERLFGKDAVPYTMALFTNGNKLKGKDIKTFVSENLDLQNFVRKCGERCFVIDNDNEKCDSAQFMELLDQIDEMVDINGGKYYTNDMLQNAEKAIEEEKQRILKETKEKLKKEMEALERMIQHLKLKEREEIKLQKAKEYEKEARIQAEKDNYFIRFLPLKWFIDLVNYFLN